MKILQFLCPQDPPAEQLKALMLAQVNAWSRLQRLANDPEYTTNPFGPEVWHEHTETEGLWWVNWDAIYSNLGDDGRFIADQMLGSQPLQGILKNAPLVNALPSTKIEIVEVADLVAAGYLPEPEILEP
jgi:hypothetical protein